MNSFLKEIEKNYNLFDISQGEIISFFKFNQDVYAALSRMMHYANRQYEIVCGNEGKKVYDFARVSIKKDQSGKCYIELIGADNHTRVIIQQDDANFRDYSYILGMKFTETRLAQEIDQIQTERLKKANIASRFLKEEPLPVNLYEEMSCKKLIDYYHYLNDYLNSNTIIEEYNEPENTTGPISAKRGITSPRVHPIVDYMVRKNALMKHNPSRTIKFKGTKTGREYDTYIYERDGYVLAIAEPISGTEYQYNLNLGPIDKNDGTLIRQMVRSALEAEEKIVMLDDAIIRKNHTTMTAFNENLDIFLNNAHSQKTFKTKVEEAKSVYSGK